MDLPDNRSIRNCAGWRSPETTCSSIMMKAVEVFHDVKSVEAAIEFEDNPDTAGSRGDEGQRVIRLIFEPSRLKLYIRPVGSMMKAMTGLVRLSVSIAPPVPTVTTTIDPSTPTFQP
jgi:hypothetical protein